MIEPSATKEVLAVVTSYLAQLLKKPYFYVPFPITRPQLNNAVNLFFQYLSLPYDIKAHIDCKIAPKHRRGDIGYRLRNPEDDIYNDQKEFFHYHPIILECYRSFLLGRREISDFVMAANTLWHAVYNTTYSIIKEFDARFPGASEKIFSTPEPHIILRFLRYDWQTAGQYLAKPHFDAGSFTLAIAESCPGLRIGKDPSDLELVEHKDGHAVFMVSSNFRKIIDCDDLAPGWHDVIQVDSSQLGKPCARWAVVAFIEGADVEALPRSETHKWHHVYENA